MHVLDPAWNAFKQEVEVACSRAAGVARAETTKELNQALRRLKHYRTEAEWIAAVLDAASRFARELALLSLRNDALVVRGCVNLNLPPEHSFALSSAGAFVSAIETKDPVIALRTPSEITQEISAISTGQRAHILPIANGSRIVALLLAAGSDGVDMNGLELIAGMASAVLERGSNASLHTQIGPTQIGGAASVPDAKPSPVPPETSKQLPPWAALSEEQRNLHIRARRFSRAAVAEMQLSRPEACRAGREQRNLYVFLQKEIDRARESYRKQFMTIPSMADYLHLELVRAAADGDELKLGADYPGELA